MNKVLKLSYLQFFFRLWYIGKNKFLVKNRVESHFTETPSHTTVQAMSHTAVLLLCLPKANERLKSPNLLNHSRFIALCTIWFKDLRHHPTDEHAIDQASCWFIFIAVILSLKKKLHLYTQSEKEIAPIE